ncbi:hypothetical protein OG21DRAFT_1506962 [Imleria badia]|nr:hypothetical protein OG21DRAFT_1506962 [Imleria badia]
MMRFSSFAVFSGLAALVVVNALPVENLQAGVPSVTCVGECLFVCPSSPPCPFGSYRPDPCCSCPVCIVPDPAAEELPAQ